MKWNNPGKGVVPSPTPRCSSYWKWSLRVTLNYGSTNFTYPYLILIIVFSINRLFGHSEAIIIIMSCHRHGYPWLSLSLATSSYRSSPQAGLQGYIPYPHIAAGCMFELVVLLLPGHMWESIGVHHLWARPCFSSSDLHCYLTLIILLNTIHSFAYS